MNIFDKLKKQIRDLLSRDSVRHIGWVYSSRMVTAVMRFAVAVVVARTLGSEMVGVLTIASVVMGISERLLEMGLTTTMVRKMSMHLSRGEEQKSASIFQRIFFVRISASVLFVIASWFVAPVIAERMFGNPALVMPLRLAGIGSLVWNVWNNTDGVLRAMEKFREVAIIDVISHVFRTVLILFFAWKAILSVEHTLIFNISQVLVAFAITSLMLPKSFFKGTSGGKYPLKEIFSYSGWIYAFSIIFMVFDRLDVLMLGYFREESEVGLYGVAFTMIKPFELLPETLNTIFLPKVSKFTKKIEIFRYFKETLKLTSIIGALCLLLIFVARPLMMFFYGAEYEQSVQLFQILVGAFILLTILNPFNLIGHSINKPQLFVIMASINLVLNFTGNIIFIPRYGAVGAAVVTLVSRVLGGLLGLLVLKKYLEKWQEES
ncbi:MAG: flippase [Candidatus Krumholzibacteria bacterium]|nr:flippase [Candidatus Krumholzibacteria bacterium]